MKSGSTAVASPSRSSLPPVPLHPGRPMPSSMPSAARKYQVIHSTTSVTPLPDGAHRRQESSPNKILYTSPRCELDDQQIFPAESLKKPEDRWQYLSKQAGSHRQESTVLHIARRQMIPQILRLGVTPQVATRILELHLEWDDKVDVLPEWLDVVSSLFFNLEHLHLDPVTAPSYPRRKNTTKNDSVSKEDVEQSKRLRRLYILYRLPNLLSIDGKPVSKKERQLARPDNPNGNRVKKEDWFDKESLLDKDDSTSGKSRSSSRNGSSMNSISHKDSVDFVSVTLPKNMLLEEKNQLKVEVSRYSTGSVETNAKNKKTTTTADQIAVLNSNTRRSDMDKLSRGKVSISNVEVDSVATSSYEWTAACGMGLPIFRGDGLCRPKGLPCGAIKSAIGKPKLKQSTDKKADNGKHPSQQRRSNKYSKLLVEAEKQKKIEGKNKNSEPKSKPKPLEELQTRRSYKYTKLLVKDESLREDKVLREVKDLHAQPQTPTENGVDPDLPRAASQILRSNANSMFIRSVNDEKFEVDDDHSRKTNQLSVGTNDLHATEDCNSLLCPAKPDLSCGAFMVKGIMGESQSNHNTDLSDDLIDGRKKDKENYTSTEDPGSSTFPNEPLSPKQIIIESTHIRRRIKGNQEDAKISYSHSGKDGLTLHVETVGDNEDQLKLDSFGVDLVNDTFASPRSRSRRLSEAPKNRKGTDSRRNKDILTSEDLGVPLTPPPRVQRSSRSRSPFKFDDYRDNQKEEIYADSNENPPPDLNAMAKNGRQSPTTQGSLSDSDISANQKLPPSKSLSSPFPMQFRERVSSPILSPVSDLVERSRRNISPASHADQSSLERPAPKHLHLTEPLPSPTQGRSPPVTPMETIESPISLSRVQSSPSKLTPTARRSASKGDLPPPCPSARRKSVPAQPVRAEKMKRALSRWKQHKSARSTSIMDDDDDDDDEEEEEEDFSSEEDDIIPEE